MHSQHGQPYKGLQGEHFLQYCVMNIIKLLYLLFAGFVYCTQQIRIIFTYNDYNRNVMYCIVVYVYGAIHC